MKEKLERFAKGDFEYELPEICLSDEEIRITVEAGKMYDGSFVIRNTSGQQMTGVVYSSEWQMKLINPKFIGVENTIAYHFNATYLKAGEEIRGELSIICDCGVKTLPFIVQTEIAHFVTSMGKIKDLFQFTNLARMDWSEAKKVFRSENFEQIFLKNEDRYKHIYRNLIKSISTSQALEEFLVTIHKKSTIQISIDKTQVEYQVSEDNIMDKLTLTKDHWGFAEIRVSTDVPFIQLEQKFLWADRFIGNIHQVSYGIDTSNLKLGINYGHIFIKTAYQTITVNVICKHRTEKQKPGTEIRKQQHMEFGLIENYLSFRLNRIDLPAYLEEAQLLMKELSGPEVTYTKELIRAHLAIISGKTKIAEELLSGFSEEESLLRKKSILEYCAYLYLNALYKKEDEVTKKAAETIRGFYESGYNDWRILWFLLYMDKRYEKNKSAKLYDIKEQFEAGCHSPILYYEAVCVLNEEPFLLRELNDFEIQALNFGIKNWIVSKEVADQYTYLANKRKNFNPVIFSGLVRLYDEYDTTEILSAICCLLIKGMKKEEKYFEWYQRGVDAQLRVTELHEYYMYSVSNELQQPLSQPVLLYFIYNSSLSDKKKAFLYANIVRNKDKLDSIYRTYLKKMEVFTIKMVEAHQISRDLALLYREFLNKNLLTPELARHLPAVMYRHELRCENKNMVSATVIHKELGAEENVTLNDGLAQINVYTKNVEIFLLDSFGNHYTESVEFSINPYLNSEDYENICAEYSNDPMLLLHLFDRYQSYRIVNDKAIALRKKVLLIEGLAEDYLTECYQSLIEYYYENYNDEMLEHYLSCINLKKIKFLERTKFVEFIVVRAFFNKAIDAFELFSYKGLPVNRLLKLCSGWMLTPASERKHALMLSLCYYVFSHGKYDDSILRYLVKYYEGPTEDMFRLWQAAKGFEMECPMLEERLLTQILFSESDLENGHLVFQTYYKDVTNNKLVRSFLSYYAYRYLVHNHEINSELFPVMKRELNYEENDICLLAWLKYNSSNTKLTENEQIFIGYQLQRLVKKGITMPFFLDYKWWVSLPDRILDKSFVTYHTNPKKQVYIHYRLHKDSEKDYITERMPNVFLGIHCKEFVLFHQELLQYYITEESAEDTNITKSLCLQYSCEEPGEDETNYNQINLMLIAYERRDEKALLALMENYIKREYIVSTCFQPINEQGVR